MKVPAITRMAGLVKVEGDAQPARSARMFDPYLTTTHPLASEIAGIVVANWNHGLPARRRRLKDRDDKAIRDMVRAIVANLALAAFEGMEPPSIGVSLKDAKRKRSRYDRPGFSGLPRVIAVIDRTVDLLSLAKSSRKGTASAITATPPFAKAVAGSEFRPHQFHIARERETIWLSRMTRDYAAGTEERELIDYRDTEETHRYRDEVGKINVALQAADLALHWNNGPPVATSVRQLHRSFNLPPDAPEGTERFDCGGRLFGGWWMNLPKERRHLIRIAGEPVADLDFASMFLRLAFLEAGEKPPEVDLYAAVPGLEEPRWREGVKKAALAMLFRTTPLLRLPKDAKGLLPPRMSGSIAREAILSAFPALASVFEQGKGLGLMFTESQILIAAMLDLADQKIPALPMHDGLMVPISKATPAARAMQDAAERICGFRLPITVKATYA
ncbi:MAG: hypothetical protein FD175_289 [Beijerinckiaceae bacterium]|nr:MAG: hypothetical protein FD175_289 [Beijerinckiaceae bacterium]